ncbi:hypothetical protein CK203_046540 [Vitis vinifera]|uniref:Retrotransposon gag domain-containing protein n=1 Tax=Vitis vinifera TaxID=29760 RepID=A0A438ILH7_VITVI|nr:hypothetical protein CK203_046540 [Vitis vinifera]
MRGSACVEVMTTLHGSAPSLRRRAEGCVPPEGMIASARDILKVHPYPFRATLTLAEEEYFQDQDFYSQSGYNFVDQRGLAGLRQEISDQQSRPPIAQDEVSYDGATSTTPPVPSVHQASPYVLHGHSGSLHPQSPRPLSLMTRMRAWTAIEQCMRQMRVSDGSVVWDDFGDFYSTVMRAHGLDEPQMITLFPLSLSGAAQRWFARIEERARALRQRTEESVSSFISRWRGKIAEIVDRPSERDQIQMVLRSLQPGIARHVVGVPFTDFGSLVMALYDVEDGITRGLWADSSSSDVKGKKPFVGPRPTEYRPRAHRRLFYDQTHMPQTLVLPSYATQGIERPAVSYTATGQPCYAAQFTARPAAPYPDLEPSRLLSVCFEDAEAVSQIGMPLSQALRKLTEAGLLTALTPRPLPQPIPAQFRMDLHCAYHQGPGHETDRCTALRHAIQDLIDQGLVHLGQPSVTTNPLPTHTTHAVPPPAGGIHFLDFDETDDHVHMLSWDDPDPEPIMPAGIYETSGVTLEPQMPAPFRLVPERIVQAPLPSL